MVEINGLKAQLIMMFWMKDLGEAKQILGIEVYKNKKNGKWWLSKVYGEDIDEIQYEHYETDKYTFIFPL
jgi:hypothetical protein